MKKHFYSLLFISSFFISGLSAQDARIWSTYYGGTGFIDGAFCTAVDPSGNVFMAGVTSSATNISAGGFQNTFGGGTVDAFLVKFDSSCNRYWGTYYGGTGDEMAFFGGKMAIATDPFGNVFLGGFTNSATGIASNGYQNTLGGSTPNGFLVKFNATGNRSWATYYGSTGVDKGYSLATDKDGNVYLAGLANSTSNIASTNGFQNMPGGGSDAFLVKFDSSGNRLWATYYGGNGTEEGYSVATDNDYNVYLAGVTSSSSGIASGGFQNSYGGGGNDAFLVKFDSSGARQWATYYGGAGDELVLFSSDLDVATDVEGNVYLCGLTSSTTNISSGGHQNVYGGGASDAFLVKFTSSGTRVWGTYYGGADDDKAYSVDVDIVGDVYLAGETNSVDSISDNGFQNNLAGSNDAFLAKFDPNGQRLCATYFGGADVDQCKFVAVDAWGYAYIAGATTNQTGITHLGYQNAFGGGTSDALLVKFQSCFNTTSVNETEGATSVSIYPNPTSGRISLYPDDNLEYALTVTDATGRVVTTDNKFFGRTEVDLSNEPRGIYFVKLVSDSKTITQQVVLK